MLPSMTNLDVDVTSEPEAAEIEFTPVDDGQGASIEATSEPTATETPVEDEPDYFDPSEYADRMVKLTVDGEEVAVPLNEVLSGYNSNAAATKRFQEASQMKQEAQSALTLAQAVQNNPGLTMQVLAQQAGLTVEQFLNLTPSQQQSVATSVEEEPEFSDPLERQLYEERKARLELEQRFEARERSFEQQAADNALRSAIGGLQSQYGATEDDARDVVGQALQMGVGPEMFPMIYQAQQFQKAQAQNQATQEAQATKDAQAAQRQQAAVQAGQVVGSGSGVVGTAPPQVVQPMTAEEAIRNTLDQFGVQ